MVEKNQNQMRTTHQNPEDDERKKTNVARIIIAISFAITLLLFAYVIEIKPALEDISAGAREESLIRAEVFEKRTSKDATTTEGLYKE